jgi:hypothetical protein
MRPPESPDALHDERAGARQYVRLPNDSSPRRGSLAASSLRDGPLLPTAWFESQQRTRVHQTEGLNDLFIGAQELGQMLLAA